MQWFPTPPTDSIAKFVAILGSWAILGFALLLLTLNFQNFETHEYLTLKQSIEAKEDFVDKAKKRIASITAGDIEKNRMLGISEATPQIEKALLLNAIAINQKELAQLKKTLPDQPPKSYFSFLQYIDFEKKWLCWFAPIVLSTVAGYMGWYRQDKRMQESLELDVEIKQHQLDTLKRPSNGYKVTSRSSIPQYRNRTRYKG